MIPFKAHLSAPLYDIPLEEPLSYLLYSPITPPPPVEFTQYYQKTSHLIMHQYNIPQVLIIHLNFQKKSLPKLYIMYQENLAVDNPHACHLHALLIFLQNNLPLHLAYRQSILTQFHIITQETLSLTSHQISLPKFHMMNQVTLPVEVLNHSHLITHQRSLLPMYLPFSIPQVLYHHYLLIKYKCNLPQFQILLPVLLAMTLPVNIPQVQSSLLLRVY